jgi:hypothetical protein
MDQARFEANLNKQTDKFYQQTTSKLEATLSATDWHL